MKKANLTPDQASLIAKITTAFEELNILTSEPKPFKYFDIMGIADTKQSELDYKANITAEFEASRKAIIESTLIQLQPLADEFNDNGFKCDLKLYSAGFVFSVEDYSLVRFEVDRVKLTANTMTTCECMNHKFIGLADLLESGACRDRVKYIIESVIERRDRYARDKARK